ncbi:MAG: hypothetical protein JW932_19085 [Deltaproteobacteria bacterium]|nr:hypothetical protein [Deltaproteobacteria bacterium]
MVTNEDIKEIEHISMVDVRSHYDSRIEIHKILKNRLLNGDVQGYVNLALGIEDPKGNYSADEYKLGPQILSESTPSAVFRLAQELFSCHSVTQIPKIIYDSNITYLKISVGSEMATMLRPDYFWVGNVRTIWASLLIKHKWNYDKADKELELYRDNDILSEMAYPKWRDIYLSLEPNLDKLIAIGNRYASKVGVKAGKMKYLWADAIANALYEYKGDD